MIVIGATDGDAAGANGEELKPLTQDADRKHVRVYQCYSFLANSL